MSAPERIFVNLSSVIVGLSGVVYGWMKYMMTSDDPFSVVNHPLQPWALDLHVLAAPAFVFAAGLVARDHILSQWRQRDTRRGRLTGLVAVSCLLPMIATGYLVQVFTGEAPRRIAVAVHLVTGIVYVAVFAAHVVLSRIAAARRSREASVASAPLRIGGARRAPAVMRAGSAARRDGPWDGSPRS